MEIISTNVTGFLQLNNISKSFGDYSALADFQTTILPGERIGLIGPNGAGKSTLLKIIAGILPHDAGEIHLDGEDLLKNKPLAKTKVAYLPDEPPLYDLLNALEFLEYTAALWKIPIDFAEPKMRDLMDDYQMTDVSNVWIKNYSKGMRQKLGLISVLFRSLPILLLDEPFTALDTDAVQTTIQYLQNRSYVKTSIIVSHDLDLLEQVVDRVVVLYHGRIVAEFSSCEHLSEKYNETKRRLNLEDAPSEV